MNTYRNQHVSRLFRHRHRQRHDAAPTEPHWLDTWLPRISHFSQFGLFAVTIGGLYFTVLPLYQKAVLEEAIARKEIELAASEKSLEQSYGRLRQLTVKEFVFAVGAKCSSLMLPSRTLRYLKGEPSLSAAEEMLNINAGACLLEAFQKAKDLKELQAKDQQTLSAQIERISTALKAKQNAARKEFESIPQRAKTDPSTLKPLDPTAKKLLDLLSRSRTWTMEERRSFTIEQAQFSVAHEYDSYVRDQIATLRSITWDAPKN